MKFYYLITFLLLLTSCRFFSTTETLILKMPDVSKFSSTGIVLSWTIRYPGRDGEIHEVISPGEQDDLLIEVDQGLPKAITIEANILVGESTNFTSRPAGFLYPYDCHSYGKGELSWERGFPALLLLSASEALNLSEINILKLLEQLEEEAEGVDYWNLDFQELLTALATGDFSVYDIRLTRELEISLNLPPGRWISGSLLSPDIESKSLEEVTIVSLFEGTRRFVHKEGMVLEVYIESDGSYDYLIYK